MEGGGKGGGALCGKGHIFCLHQLPPTQRPALSTHFKQSFATTLALQLLAGSTIKCISACVCMFSPGQTTLSKKSKSKTQLLLSKLKTILGVFEKRVCVYISSRSGNDGGARAVTPSDRSAKKGGGGVLLGPRVPRFPDLGAGCVTAPNPAGGVVQFRRPSPSDPPAPSSIAP